MEESLQRYAVVTGANKGIGLEVVRQLASAGIKVVLTARNEKKGLQALENLKASGLSHLVLFHQLDVTEAASVASLAGFIKSKFGKLDILANNAGVGGIEIKDKDLYALVIIKHRDDVSKEDLEKAMTQTYELAEDCFQINYYGVKRTSKSLLPLLLLSDSPRIVNVSSSLGKLEYISNEHANRIFSDVDNLTKERVDEVLKEFLKDFEESTFESKGWLNCMSAYIISKSAANAYSRVLAKQYPTICINSACPGYCKTDMTMNTGFFTVEEGAASVVSVALLPNGSPSGLFYNQNEVSSF